MVDVVLVRKVIPGEDKMGEENQKVNGGEGILWAARQDIIKCHQAISILYASAQGDNYSN